MRDVTLLDPDDRSVPLADVVGERPTLLVFLRHFG